MPASNPSKKVFPIRNLSFYSWDERLELSLRSYYSQSLVYSSSRQLLTLLANIKYPKKLQTTSKNKQTSVNVLFLDIVFPKPTAPVRLHKLIFEWRIPESHSFAALILPTLRSFESWDVLRLSWSPQNPQTILVPHVRFQAIRNSDAIEAQLGDPFHLGSTDVRCNPRRPVVFGRGPHPPRAISPGPRRWRRWIRGRTSWHT